VRVTEGRLEFRPILLRKSEFLREPGTFEGFDVRGKAFRVELQPESLAFGYCGVPVVYHLDEVPRIELRMADGTHVAQSGVALTTAQAAEVFARSGLIGRIDVWTRAEL
jgi:hypothetical protein